MLSAMLHFLLFMYHSKKIWIHQDEVILVFVTKAMVFSSYRIAFVKHSCSLGIQRDLFYAKLHQGGHGTGKTGNLVLTFSRQGKHREFCSDTGKNLLTQGKYLDCDY